MQEDGTFAGRIGNLAQLAVVVPQRRGNVQVAGKQNVHILTGRQPGLEVVAGHQAEAQPVVVGGIEPTEVDGYPQAVLPQSAPEGLLFGQCIMYARPGGMGGAVDDCHAVMAVAQRVDGALQADGYGHLVVSQSVA